MEIYIVLCDPRQVYLFPAVSTLGYKGDYGGDGSAAVQAQGMGEITAVVVLFRSIPCARAPPQAEDIVPEVIIIAGTSGKVIHICNHKTYYYERLCCKI